MIVVFFVYIGRVNYPNPTQKIEKHDRTAADQQKAHIQRNRGNRRATQIEERLVWPWYEIFWGPGVRVHGSGPVNGWQPAIIKVSTHINQSELTEKAMVLHKQTWNGVGRRCYGNNYNTRPRAFKSSCRENFWIFFFLLQRFTFWLLDNNSFSLRKVNSIAFGVVQAFSWTVLCHALKLIYKVIGLHRVCIHIPNSTGRLWAIKFSHRCRGENNSPTKISEVSELLGPHWPVVYNKDTVPLYNSASGGCMSITCKIFCFLTTHLPNTALDIYS